MAESGANPSERQGLTVLLTPGHVSESELSELLQPRLRHPQRLVAIHLRPSKLSNLGLADVAPTLGIVFVGIAAMESERRLAKLAEHDTWPAGAAEAWRNEWRNRNPSRAPDVASTVATTVET